MKKKRMKGNENEEKGNRKKGKEASSCTCTFSAQCQLEATSNKQQATSEKDRRSSCSTRCPLNPTPLQQCKVKPNTCMYSVHSKKSCAEPTCNAQDVDGAVVVCRKQKMDQKKSKKTEKVPKPPAHLPHAIYHMLCWPNFKLSATCMYEGCECQPEHIHFNWSRPSFSPSLLILFLLSLTLSLSLSHSPK